jgi:hypothetical protein
MAKHFMGHVLMPTMWVRLPGCTLNSVSVRGVRQQHILVTLRHPTVFLLGILSLGQLSDFDLNL